MKKLQILTVLLFVYIVGIKAQDADHKHTITGNAASSLAGFLFHTVNDPAYKYTSNAHQAFQFSYEYFVKKWFSISFAYSQQKLDIDFDKYTYTVDTVVAGIPVQHTFVETFGVDLKRQNFALKAIFHYQTERNDFYTAIRLGMTKWELEGNIKDENFDISKFVNVAKFLKYSFWNFAPQWAVFGWRGYFTDWFGMNLEFAVGAPHFLSYGINFRF